MESIFLQNVNQLINDGKLEDVLKLLKDSSQSITLYEKGLDLIPVICKQVSRCRTEDDISLEVSCEEILIELARRGNAKEILIGLLEQADNQDDDIKFRILLKPIRITLERIPAKRAKSLEWVLTVFYSHVTSLPLPKNYGFEGEERKLIDLDPDNQRIVNVLSNLIVFYEPFVKEISLNTKTPSTFYDDNVNFHRNKLTFFLLQLLDRPLVFLDLTYKSGESKSTIYTIAEKLVVYIKQLQSNFCNLFTLYSQDSTTTRKLKCDKTSRVDSHEENDNKVSDLSLATFFYLIFAEGIEFSHMPCVYTHIYIVESCLPFVNAMLERSEEFITQKGILLSSALIKKLREKELGVMMLDFNQHLILAQNLINIMMHNQVQEFRRKSCQLLEKYISRYDMQGRYQLLKCLLTSNDHSGVQGLLIQYYKNNLHETIQHEPILPYFSGQNLDAIFSIIARLPEGIETDLLDQSDRILGTLNLIRFLALTDDYKKNVTGFWNLVKNLENGFLSPLKKALELSRAHYQFELKCSEEKIERVDLGIPKMQSEQVLKLALNTFDVIESVVSRVVELLCCVKV